VTAVTNDLRRLQPQAARPDIRPRSRVDQRCVINKLFAAYTALQSVAPGGTTVMPDSLELLIMKASIVSPRFNAPSR
jgi:hypothetical protein